VVGGSEMGVEISRNVVQLYTFELGCRQVSEEPQLSYQSV